MSTRKLTQMSQHFSLNLLCFLSYNKANKAYCDPSGTIGDLVETIYMKKACWRKLSMLE